MMPTYNFRERPQPRENETIACHVAPAYTMAEARSGARADQEADLFELARHYGGFARVARYWPEGAEACGYCLFLADSWWPAVYEAADIARAADAYCLATGIMFRRHCFPARRWYSRLKRRHPEHAAHWMEEGRKLGRRAP